VKEMVQMASDIRHIKNKTEDTNTQVKLTNGRVRKLEVFKSNVIYTTIGVILTFVFMIYAANHGWVEAIIEFGK
jgi:hypothetical protein